MRTSGGPSPHSQNAALYCRRSATPHRPSIARNAAPRAVSHFAVAITAPSCVMMLLGAILIFWVMHALYPFLLWRKSDFSSSGILGTKQVAEWGLGNNKWKGLADCWRNDENQAPAALSADVSALG